MLFGYDFKGLGVDEVKLEGRVWGAEIRSDDGDDCKKCAYNFENKGCL